MNRQAQCLCWFSPVAGVDYILKNAAVRLRPGAARSCVGIQIVEDLLVETTERFELKLVSLDSNLVSVLGSNSVVFINDNDCKFSHFDYSCYICYYVLCHIVK